MSNEDQVMVIRVSHQDETLVWDGFLSPDKDEIPIYRHNLLYQMFNIERL